MGVAHTVRNRFMKKLLILISGLLFTITVSLVIFAEEGNAFHKDKVVSSSWQQVTERFTYSGFNTYYSCRGIEGELKKILMEFGARNIKARAIGCGPNHVNRTLSVRLSFESLIKTNKTTNGNNQDNQIVEASYQAIDFSQFTGLKNRNRGNAQCELIYALSRSKVMQYFEYIEHSKMRLCSSGYSTFSDIKWSISTLKSNN